MGVGTLATNRVYQEVTKDPKKNDRFDEVASPSAAQPGDVLVKEGHIRVVAEVTTAQDRVV